LAVGDLANTGKNLLVVISAEGSCHVFDVPPDEQDAPPPDASKVSSDGPKSLKKSDPNNLVGSQSIPMPSTGTDRDSLSTSTLAAISSTPLAAGRRDATTGSLSASMDTIHATSVLDSQQDAAENQNSSAAAPKSATKAGKTGTLSFYSSIQTEKLAALASARQGATQTVSSTQPAPNQPGSAAITTDKTSRADTHTGIATSLLDQFKRVATPSNSRPDSPALPEPEADRRPLKSSDTSKDQNIRASGAWKKSTDKMEPTFRFFVEPIIGDLDEDGRNELIIGSNNRAIYAYEFVQNDSDAAGQPILLKLKARWHLASQVTSLCLTADRWGRPVLLAGLTGGTYAVIDHSQELSYKQISASGSSSHKSHIRDDRTGPAEIITTRQSTSGNQYFSFFSACVRFLTVRLKSYRGFE
jgi:hypothetical protein